MRCLAFLITVPLLGAPTARAQEIPVEELTLDNGMTFLLLERHEEPHTIACGWVARAGSVNERPGTTGLSHFFEHLMFKGTSTIGVDDDTEFSAIYSEAGATGLNAFTTQDFTFFHVDVPSNKLELWAWMESDRLLDLAYRGFDTERAVVHEERRMRLESAPTGLLDEQFDAMFWIASPYAWPVIGWPSDLAAYTLDDARDYFDTYYAPDNLVAVLVGDFDPEQVKPMLTEYFGRLEPGPPPRPVVTMEPPQLAEQRLNGACACAPQVRIAYHAVPFGHPDVEALAVLAEALDGRTGRLHRALVEGVEIATSVSATLDPRRFGGVFEVRIEARGDATPSDLETAWDGQVRRLQADPLTDAELGRMRSRIVADQYRSLRTNAALRTQLGVYAALGSWRYLEERPKRLLAVTREDVMRVARRYLQPTNRSVAHYTRAIAAELLDPALAGLPPAVQAGVRALLERTLSLTDPGQVAMVVAGLRAQVAGAPEDSRAALEFVIERLEKHLAALQRAEGGER